MKLSRENVVVEGTKDEVVYVSIDWDRVPTGGAATSFSITAPGMDPVRVTVKTEKAAPAGLPSAGSRYYGSLTGPIVVPASGFAKKTGANGAEWQEVSGLGRWGNAMAVFPVSSTEAVPTLEYSVYIAKPGKVTVDVEIMPIYPDKDDTGLHGATYRELRIRSEGTRLNSSHNA